MRVLFIGNSHTYFNDMPALFAEFAKEQGSSCEVTMIAHGGWSLEQHVAEPDVRFNILYGHYDYVVLQEHAHPFGPEAPMFEAIRQLNAWIREAGSRLVLYMTWSMKKEPEVQPRMTAAYETIGEELGALVAPVGEVWWQQVREHPETEYYFEDGAHASRDGSLLAARVILKTILDDCHE